MTILARIITQFIRADYNGPARLEVFGHRTYIGWVRSTNERIDVLTVEGDAIQLDTHSRFQLTPLMWQELVDEALEVKRLRHRDIDFSRDERDWLRENLKEQDALVVEMRLRLLDALKLTADSYFQDLVKKLLAVDDNSEEIGF
jgi:hypothetical protein